MSTNDYSHGYADGAGQAHEQRGEEVEALRARVAELDRELNGVREASATELRAAYKRVAELDASLAFERAALAQERADNFAVRTKLMEATAHANALRDALTDMLPGLSFSQQCHIRSLLDDAPAASLAAHDAEVLERAAACAESYLWNLPAIQSQVGANCGDAIRALAAQEVKP